MEMNKPNITLEGTFSLFSFTCSVTFKGKRYRFSFFTKLLFSSNVPEIWNIRIFLKENGERQVRKLVIIDITN